MPKDAKEKACAEVQRAQSKFARVDSERDQTRIARREVFERAREAGLTLREIGATELLMRWRSRLTYWRAAFLVLDGGTEGGTAPQSRMGKPNAMG